MINSRISLKTIQAFEAAARYESFGLAAQELFVTPSAVSHQIKHLESEVGIKLFHREHRAVVLTDAGRRYAEEITAAFDRIGAATRELGRTSKSNVLTLNSSPSIAVQWLMPRLARFSSRFPDIDVRLNTSHTVSSNFSETIDIDIRYGLRQLSPAGISTLPFPAETVVPLCSPSLADSQFPIRKPEDIQKHTLIHSEHALFKWSDWMNQQDGVELDLSRGHRFNRSFMAISSAVDGLGVCLESLLLVQRELEGGKLVAPLGTEGFQVNAYTFNIMKSKMELPKIKCFQEWLFSELGKTHN